VLSLVGAGLLLFSAAVPSVSAAAPNADFAARVLDLTNAERAKAGLAPLAPSLELTGAAQGYAEVLATSSCFAHTCGPVPELTARTELAGYRGWVALGENIAGGQQGPERVVQMWMESPGHRANILDPSFTEIGIGVAAGGELGAYWTQAFGAR
jgi:uncharacterized protein YkwD